MSRQFSRGWFILAVVATLATVLLSPHLAVAVSKDALPVPAPASVPANMPDDAAAMWLAMRVAEGAETGRPALVAALDRMGWSVKDREGNLTRAPAIAQPTGLAMRDYEVEMLFWNLDDQPGIRLINYAQALTVVLPTADAEELAQGLLDAIRKGAESQEPRQRFWARFIIALGLAQNAVDLSGPGDPHVVMPHAGELADVMGKAGLATDDDEGDDEDEASAMRRGMAAMAAMMQSKDFSLEKLLEASTPIPAWPIDDPVLAPSPKPTAIRAGTTQPPAPAKSPDARMNEVVEEMGTLYEKLANPDPRVAAKAQERFNVLQVEMQNLNQSMMVSNFAGMARKPASDDEDEDEDEDDEGGGSRDSRFLAEHRATPLSLLQSVLLTRVVVAEILGDPSQARSGAAESNPQRIVTASLFPFRFPLLAQAGGPPTTFGGQVVSAGADMWATGWGTYTNHILDVNLPDSKFSDRVGKANAIMGWIKTIMMLATNKITVEVENVPLIRTKTRTAGEPRRAKSVVIIDFPKSGDGMKALRAAGNIAGVDIQVIEGGPVSGAKVVWRLPEGSYNGKYATKGGGSTYRPDLAVVQFAGLKPGAKGTSAYTSFTNDDGEAFIDIEGAPQRKDLPKDVRKHPRRAAIAVEVTMKVGNLTQDFSDAFGTSGLQGNVGVLGVITIISEMVQRTSLFFQKGRAFEVTDWVKPAWEGEFVVTVTASGSKKEKGQKGGPDVSYEWSMNRAMEARLQSPEWEQEEALEAAGADSDVSILEISDDTKRYKVTDFSSQSSRDVEAAFSAEGPVEIQAAARNQLQIFSRSEPSGYGRLHTFPQSGQYRLSLEPFFAAKAQIFNFERSKGRSRTENRVGPYDLLQGVHPSDLTDVGTYDPASGMISGRKTIDARGSLPHVPGFDVTVEFAYTLRYNAAPPQNKR